MGIKKTILPLILGGALAASSALYAGAQTENSDSSCLKPFTNLENYIQEHKRYLNDRFDSLLSRAESLSAKVDCGSDYSEYTSERKELRKEVDETIKQKKLEDEKDRLRGSATKVGNKIYKAVSVFDTTNDLGETVLVVNYEVTSREGEFLDGVLFRMIVKYDSQSHTWSPVDDESKKSKSKLEKLIDVLKE